MKSMRATRYIVLTLAILLVSSAAVAEISDTPNGRSFYTTRNKCTLTTPRGDFTIAREQIKPDGTTIYYLLANEKKFINFSFFIDTVSTQCSNADKCLDLVLTNKAYAKAVDLKRYERAGFSIAEFNLDIPAKDGAVVVQKNLLAEKYLSGCWVDIHISQMGMDAPDVNNILPILDSISIEQ